MTPSERTNQLAYLRGEYGRAPEQCESVAQELRRHPDVAALYWQVAAEGYKRIVVHRSILCVFAMIMAVLGWLLLVATITAH